MRRLWPLTARGTGALILGDRLLRRGERDRRRRADVLRHPAPRRARRQLGVAVPRAPHRPRHPVAVAGCRDGRPRRDVVASGSACAPPFPTPPAPGATRSPGRSGHGRGAFPALGSGLRGGEKVVELAYTVTGARRGIHSLGPLTVHLDRSVRPARRRTVFGDQTPVTIAPAIVELSPLTEPARRRRRNAAYVDEPARPGRRQPRRAAVCSRRLDAPHPLARDRAPRRADGAPGGAGVHPEAVVVLDRGVLRWSAEAMRPPGADPGFETAVSARVSVVARLVHDGYAVEVLDSDGTPLAERIDGGDMTEVEDADPFATLTARRDDSLSRLPRLFHGVMTGPVILIVGRLDAADAELSRRSSTTARCRSCSRCRRRGTRSIAPPMPAGTSAPSIPMRISRRVEARRRARGEPCLRLSACGPTSARRSAVQPDAPRRAGPAPPSDLALTIGVLVASSPRCCRCVA